MSPFKCLSDLQDVPNLLPLHGDIVVVDRLSDWLRNPNSSTKKLQRKEYKLHYAQSLFRGSLREGLMFASWLKPEAYIVANKGFESGIANIQSGRKILTRTKKASVGHLLRYVGASGKRDENSEENSGVQLGKGEAIASFVNRFLEAVHVRDKKIDSLHPGASLWGSY